MRYAWSWRPRRSRHRQSALKIARDGASRAAKMIWRASRLRWAISYWRCVRAAPCRGALGGLTYFCRSNGPGREPRDLKQDGSRSWIKRWPTIPVAPGCRLEFVFHGLEHSCTGEWVFGRNIRSGFDGRKPLRIISPVELRFGLTGSRILLGDVFHSAHTTASRSVCNIRVASGKLFGDIRRVAFEQQQCGIRDYRACRPKQLSAFACLPPFPGAHRGTPRACDVVLATS